MSQQVIEKCNRLGLATVQFDRLKLISLRQELGEMNSTQALLSCIEQEAIIAVYGKDVGSVQSTVKTINACDKRDKFLEYALLLEKEEKESLTTK